MRCPKATIIVLNWNGWRETLDCLESLSSITYPNFDVLIVDNGSDDGSVAKIADYCENEIALHRVQTRPSQSDRLITFQFDPHKVSGIDVSAKKTKNSIKQLTLTKCKSNLGFAKANNIGMKYSLDVLHSQYILLLNNDTIVDQHFLGELINVAETHDAIGICAPKLLKMGNDHMIDSTGHILRWGRIVSRGAGMVDKNQFDDQIDVVGAKGAAALYKARMLNEIGLFDEEYVTTYEDAELSWRANILGWRAKYVPNSVVYHISGKTIKRNKTILTKHILLSANNTITTVQRYGSYFQKLQFAFPLLRDTSYVVVGRLVRQNEVNITSYCKFVLFRYLAMILGPLHSVFVKSS
jgi:GT2 family glycosyltransferase